jgi:hypothetical protein
MKLLTILGCISIPKITDTGIQALAVSTNCVLERLHTLEIGGCPNLTMLSMHSIFTHCKQLQRLQLDIFGNESLSTFQVLPLFANYPLISRSLETLVFIGNSDWYAMSPDRIITLYETIYHQWKFPRLKYLKLWSVALTERFFRTIVDNAPSLEAIDVHFSIPNIEYIRVVVENACKINDTESREETDSDNSLPTPHANDDNDEDDDQYVVKHRKEVQPLFESSPMVLFRTLKCDKLSEYNTKHSQAFQQHEHTLHDYAIEAF